MTTYKGCISEGDLMKGVGDDGPAPAPLQLLDQLAPRCEDPLEYQEHDDDDGRRKNIKRNRRMQARHYGSLIVRLKLLERWLELGIRPSREDMFRTSLLLHPPESNDRNNEQNDSVIALLQDPEDRDLPKLQHVVKEARQELWRHALQPAYHNHVRVGPSDIPGAALGLFATRDLPADTVCCFCSGDVHSNKSSQTMLQNDPSYLLRLGPLPSGEDPWWYEALECKQEQNTNDHDQDDPACVYEWLRQQWDHNFRDCDDDLYVNSTNPNIQGRYINDCLDDNGTNVVFVVDPAMERASVVALRPISAGEELFVSYGTAYWDSMQDAVGIVPKHRRT